MTTEATNNSSGSGPDAPRPIASPRPTTARRVITGAVVVAIFAVGAAGGAGAYHRFQKHHPHSVLLLQPAPIAQMTDRGPVAVKGRVDEVFGNKFIVQDESGRTLVDTGPRGEGAKPVAKGDTITVQGHFDRGVIRANVMTLADGTSEEFGPDKRPHKKHGHGDEGSPPAPAR